MGAAVSLCCLSKIILKRDWNAVSTYNVIISQSKEKSSIFILADPLEAQSSRMGSRPIVLELDSFLNSKYLSFPQGKGESLSPCGWGVVRTLCIPKLCPSRAARPILRCKTKFLHQLGIWWNLLPSNSVSRWKGATALFLCGAISSHFHWGWGWGGGLATLFS